MTFLHPPLPPLEFTDPYWEGLDRFPAWADLRIPEGLDATHDTEDRITVYVHGPGMEESNPPTAEQVAGYARFRAHEGALKEAVLRALVPYALERRTEDPWFLDRIPADLTVDALRSLVLLSYVTVMAHAKDGLAYVGLSLGCAWDPEHGCGAMTHAGRVVGVGESEAAFDPGPVRQDGGHWLEA